MNRARTNINQLLHPAKTPSTAAEIKAALGISVAIAEAVREAGEIPSGTLYAIVMGKLSLASYEAVLRTLAGAGLIKVENHLVRWTGPELAVR